MTGNYKMDEIDLNYFVISKFGMFRYLYLDLWDSIYIWISILRDLYNPVYIWTSILRELYNPRFSILWICCNTGLV